MSSQDFKPFGVLQTKTPAYSPETAKVLNGIFQSLKS